MDYGPTFNSLLSLRRMEPSTFLIPCYKGMMAALKSPYTGSLYTHGPVHMNFHSRHPVHVKRELVKCLFERARNIITTQESLQEEHVVEALKQNRYHSTFICAASKPWEINRQIKMWMWSSQTGPRWLSGCDTEIFTEGGTSPNLI